MINKMLHYVGKYTYLFGLVISLALLSFSTVSVKCYKIEGSFYRLREGGVLEELPLDEPVYVRYYAKEHWDGLNDGGSYDLYQVVYLVPLTYSVFPYLAASSYHLYRSRHRNEGVFIVSLMVFLLALSFSF
mgnify:CR=1 FL=1